MNAPIRLPLVFILDAAVPFWLPIPASYIAEASKLAGIGYLPIIKRQRFLSAALPISYHKTKSLQVLSSQLLFSILNTSKTKGCVSTVKYMHFNASCSYCALAEMLKTVDLDTEDVQIAQEIRLPWLFAKEDDTYLSGPMLQGKRWFDLWLNPRGLAFSESVISSETLTPALQLAQSPVMLGLQTPYGKHAVVFQRFDRIYHFFNPTHEGSGEPTALSLSEEELLHSVDSSMMIGQITASVPHVQSIKSLLQESIQVLRENAAEITAFSSVPHAPEDYPPAMNRLFRPLLLDGISMLQLVGEVSLAQGFSSLQQDFMRFLRSPRTDLLSAFLSLETLHALSEKYIQQIENQLASCS